MASLSGAQPAQAGVDSPCNGICKIDPATRLCMGCFRTLDEIAVWARSSTAQQADIKASAARRLGGPARARACARCRSYFSCAGEPGCWCVATPVARGEACLCPICQRARP